MSFQEKRLFASIASFMLVFGIYFAVVFPMYYSRRFNGADGTSLLGKSILLLMIGVIIVSIVATIAFSIVTAIAEKESHPSFVIDERDQLIELKGLRISDYVTGAGFVLSMGVLAAGYSTFLVLNLIVASFALGTVIGSIVRLRMYRKGL